MKKHKDVLAEVINHSSVQYVHQGHAIILSNPLPGTLLLVSNLSTCIGIAVFNKQANIIGLAHVDFNRTVESIVSFVSQMRSSEEEPLELVLKGAKMESYYSDDEVTGVNEQIDAVLKQLRNVKITKNIFKYSQSGKFIDTLAIDAFGCVFSSENFYVMANNVSLVKKGAPHGSIFYNNELTDLLISIPPDEFYLECLIGKKVELRVKKIDESLEIALQNLLSYPIESIMLRFADEVLLPESNSVHKPLSNKKKHNEKVIDKPLENLSSSVPESLEVTISGAESSLSFTEEE